MKYLITSILAAILFVACSAVPLTPETAALKACRGYRQALDTVSTLRDIGQLSASDRSAVNDVVAIVGPWCESPELEDFDLDAINDNVDDVLLRIIASRSKR